jgi:predicted PurR-regulated permease PerM
MFFSLLGGLQVFGVLGIVLGPLLFAIAAAILRHLHAVITTGQAWDPVVATYGTRHRQAPIAA